MRTVPQQSAQITRPDSGEWLMQILDESHRELASRPSRKAVRRIRSRLLEAMRTPARKAA